MHRVIEVIVSPNGGTKIQTRGYSGSDCLAASRFLEEALGVNVAEAKTAEYYHQPAAEQQVQQ